MDPEWLELPVLAHEASHRVNDPGRVGVEQLARPLEMVGQPEVVVGQPGDDAPRCQLEHLVAVRIAGAEPLRPVEDLDAIVAESENRLLGAVGATVGDDEDSCRRTCLLERAGQRQKHRLAAVVGGNANRELHRHADFIPW